jgi:hypothetical protein
MYLLTASFILQMTSSQVRLIKFSASSSSDFPHTIIYQPFYPAHGGAGFDLARRWAGTASLMDREAFPPSPPTARGSINRTTGRCLQNRALAGRDRGLRFAVLPFTLTGHGFFRSLVLPDRSPNSRPVLVSPCSVCYCALRFTVYGLRTGSAKTYLQHKLCRGQFSAFWVWVKFAFMCNAGRTRALLTHTPAMFQFPKRFSISEIATLFFILGCRIQVFAVHIIQPNR